MRDPFALLVPALFALTVTALACSAADDSADSLVPGGRGGGPGAGGNSGAGGTAIGGSDGGISPSDSGAGGAPVDCKAEAKLIYLVSYQNDLYSFDPDSPGLAAYRQVGRLQCKPRSSGATPQTMGVNKSAVAHVLYSSGEMFFVSTKDASCQPTNYVHPDLSQIPIVAGMSFTSRTAGKYDERLFVQMQKPGLAEVDPTTLQATKLNALQNTMAELTGGIDAKLFMFDAITGEISEINTSSYAKTLVKKLSVNNVNAWAFARYAGIYYVFTAKTSTTGGTFENSKCTAYDPQKDVESVRDANIGFTVIGAGQSICAPPPPPPQ